MFYIPPTKIKNMFHRYLESINPFITQKLNFTVKRYAIYLLKFCFPQLLMTVDLEYTEEEKNTRNQWTASLT